MGWGRGGEEEGELLCGIDGKKFRECTDLKLTKRKKEII